MRNMAQAMNQSNVNNAAQLDQLASMFSQQKAMLENQNTEMQELRAQLAAQKVKGSSYAEGADGAEAWIADAILEADLAETHFWWHTIKQRWENEHESLLRSRIFSYITSLVPIEMYDQLADGDVRGIYINIIEMGTKEAAEQIVSLEAEIARLSKSGRPMAAWLNALYEIFSQLAILGQPRTVNQIRVMIYTNLASDQRYSNVVRDIKRNPQWSMVAIRGALEAEATSLNDLLPNQGHGVHTQEMRKKAHAAKRAKKAERYDSDSDNDDPPTYPDDTTTKPKKKALTGKAAHPGAKDKRTPKAEAPAKSAAELRLLAEEPCLRFQTGACPFGDACYRKHITLNQGEVTKLTEGLAEQRDEGICYMFRANGACSFGDKCAFSHDVAKSARVRVRRTPKAHVKERSGVPAVHGDLVVLTQACPVPALRGALGQAHKSTGNRTHVQLILNDVFLTTGGVGIRQWVASANTAGLLASEYIVCAPGERHIAMAACTSRNEHAPRGNGPYSLNAIFDTGSNTILSSRRGLFSDLRPLGKPELVEGLDGAFCQASHVGTLSMMLGTHQRVFPEAYYCADSVHTIIPGKLFDNDEYAFMGKNQSLHILKCGEDTDTVLVSYPRDVTVDPSSRYSDGFLSDLGPRTAQGDRRHTIYPIPDSAFVWNHAKTMVATRSSSMKTVQFGPEENKAGPSSEEASKLPLSGKDAKKAKSIDLLGHFHHLHGHRSPEYTARMYEYTAGYQLSNAAIAEQLGCEACDTAKITSHPSQKTRLVPITAVGSDIAADTLVSMPRSVNGYKHVAHMHDIKSNYGAVFCLKTKQCADRLLYWIQWVQNRTGKNILRLHIDGGEMKSDKLVAFLETQGSEVVENLAHVHSNTTIERRHRTLNEMHNAGMHIGGANGTLWEYSIPQANQIINLNLPIKALRAAGRLRPGSIRPLTPFEMLECSGEYIEMKKLWADIHPLFTKCVGKTEAVMLKQHEPRGMVGTYFGPISLNGNVSQYGHYMLRHSDKKVIKVRTVKCYPGEYPMRPGPKRSLSLTSDSGGEGEAKEPEAKASEYVAQGKVVPQDKFPTGTEAMTTVGPCIILGRYKDGDYQVTFPEACEPQEVRSVRFRDLWLLADYPDWGYNTNGERTSTEYVCEPASRTPHLPGVDDIDMEAIVVDSTEEEKESKPATRSRAKMVAKRATMRGPGQYKVYDRGRGTLKTLHYPYHDIPKRIAFSAKVTMPPGMKLKPTLDDIKEMEACDIERVLPKHWHQTLGHPLERFLQDAEIVELQDCINRNVFGPPELITDDKIVIGLMWVYAVKKFDTTGLFRKFRSRITLLGNQERNLLPKLDAYAPVAQSVTARLMLAAHLHIAEVFFRKLDIANAYINENMKRTVFCKMPPGYKIEVINGRVSFRRLRKGEKTSAWCLRLIKALYGGMECGRIFWEAWVDWHLKDGFQIIHEERCYLHKRSPDGSFIKFAYHVDDNIIIAKGEEYYQDYLVRLAVKFDFTEGVLDSHLGVAYHFDRAEGIVRIEQSAQTRKMLKEFGYEDCKPAKAPTMPGPPPCAADCEEPYEERFDMEGFIGHANYLHMCTRPDIGQVLKILSRFTKRFGRRHVHYAQHLLRYLKGTINDGLTYRTGFPLYYQVFTDASHASCVDTRRSITSIVVKFGGNTVYWKNSFTKIVSHSSTESELMALDIGATIGQCLRWLMEAIGGPVQGRIQIFVDNQGTISISSNPIQSGRNLHVHARYYYVRDLVYNDQFVIEHLPTDLQVADIGCTFKGTNSFITLKGHLMSCARIVHDEHGSPFWQTRA